MGQISQQLLYWCVIFLHYSLRIHRLVWPTGSLLLDTYRALHDQIGYEGR